jgi:hypothetical protein
MFRKRCCALLVAQVVADMNRQNQRLVPLRANCYRGKGTAAAGGMGIAETKEAFPLLGSYPVRMAAAL